MKNPWLFLNNLTVDENVIDSNTTVILGFTGYGSIGTAVLNHLIEELEVKSIGYWGTMSWFHKNNLEAPITIYNLNLQSEDEKEKFVLVTSRLPIPVVGLEALPDAFWKWLAGEISSWKAKRYIIIGGLREEIRNSSDDSWVTLIPTTKYTEIYGTKRNFREDLSIKGPINFLLYEGFAFNYPILAILSYCNTYDIDLDAALLALKELEKHVKLDLKSENITEFDSTLLETQFGFYEDDEDFDEEYEEEYEEDFDDFKNLKDLKESDFSFASDSLRGNRNNKEDLEKYK